MTDIVRDCPCCGSAREFSQIHLGSGRCPDSRDGCCPEWFCTACGAAVLVGVPPAGRSQTASAHSAGRLDRVA
jgi:hypothetical protein